MSNPSILILFAHPNRKKSRINQIMIETISDLEGVTLHDLYEVYPDFFIDVSHEQNLLRQHATIIFQHPIYWYSCPAILKEWLDLVLEKGFAYNGGYELEGKCFQSVVTTGGSAEAYQVNGYHQHTLSEFLLPFEQMALLCKMTPMSPFALHGSGRITDAQIHAHAQAYRKHLQQLMSDAPTSESH